MNTFKSFLVPSIVFVVGIILGVGGMSAVGVRIPKDYKSEPLCKGLPDVAGISGKGLAIISDNELVKQADLRVKLQGMIGNLSVEDRTITLISGQAAPITVQLNDKLVEQIDLTVYDKVEVSGLLQGDKVIADSVTELSQ